MRRILIANRGEIALRIMRTCRAMGIETVAVYSEFDRNALHVRMADQAVPIGPAAPRESYLNTPAILQAAQLCKVDAIHPGYGFLAENADFAAACENAEIIFIGPRSNVIRAMGSKIEARRLAQEAGVPVVPGASENDLSRLGFPILIKASAGGGGRGMRIVHQASEFREAADAARSEAERAFGDGALLFEKYVEGARHVEIQILGDHHGNLMHLNERDCSVQRRHQKIIEESPSPAVTPELRERMGEAALKLAKKIGYTNAGTVEFLLPPHHAQNQNLRVSGAPVLAPSGDFYFIEVNTRIQVEHPVTEMATGLDLIRLQIEIAKGERLPAERQQPNRHAIEARLYAEDPLNNFLPSTGTLHVWELPQGMDDLRVDTGVEAGTEVGVHYDSLLAKIIAHAADRETAINKLVYALRHLVVLGVESNREFLIDVLEHEEFRAERAHTGFQLIAKQNGEHQEVFEEIARAYALRVEQASRKILPSLPVRWGRAEVKPQAGSAAALGCEILRIEHQGVEALVDGIHYHFRISCAGEAASGAAEGGCGPNTFYIRSGLGQRAIVRPSRFPRAGAAEGQTANSPMPGQVLRILVREGQHVRAGDALIALEAMKMEQTIKATMDGTVERILVRQGEIVAPGQKLVEIQSEKSNEHPDRTGNAAANN